MDTNEPIDKKPQTIKDSLREEKNEPPHGEQIENDKAKTPAHPNGRIERANQRGDVK